jgi:hypothetical protein
MSTQENPDQPSDYLTHNPPNEVVQTKLKPIPDHLLSKKYTAIKRLRIVRNSSQQQSEPYSVSDP